MKNGTVHGCRDQALSVTVDGVRGLRDLTTDQLSGLLKAAHREYAMRFPRNRRVPMPAGVRIIKSADLALVAYWQNNGVPVVGLERNTNPTAGFHQFTVFVLADIENNADRLKIEYLSSESAKTDSTIRVLKKMAAEFRDKHGRRQG